MTNQEILRDYKETKATLDILQKEVDSKKTTVVKVLEKLPKQRAQLDGATFTLRSYKIYKYSKDVTELAITLRELQTGEVKTGKAEVIRETFAPVLTLAKAKRKGGEE